MLHSFGFDQILVLPMASIRVRISMMCAHLSEAMNDKIAPVSESH